MALFLKDAMRFVLNLILLTFFFFNLTFKAASNCSIVVQVSLKNKRERVGNKDL